MSAPPEAINITHAVVQNNNPIQNNNIVSPNSHVLGGGQNVGLQPQDQGELGLPDQNQLQNQLQNRQYLMALQQERDDAQRKRLTCFACQFISFIFAFITEQVTSNHFAYGLTTGCIAIIFGFPIPIVFFNMVLGRFYQKRRTYNMNQTRPKHREGFLARQIAAMILYMAAIITGTILLYEGINQSYNITGMVIVTSSLLCFSTMLIYVDLVEDEIPE